MTGRNVGHERVPGIAIVAMHHASLITSHYYRHHAYTAPRLWSYELLKKSKLLQGFYFFGPAGKQWARRWLSSQLASKNEARKSKKQQLATNPNSKKIKELYQDQGQATEGAYVIIEDTINGIRIS